jgi:long-subunit fatty acid transport protein
MRNLFKTMMIGLFAATPAFSGGWEASRLDTSMMYKDGSYAEVGTSSISYDITATTQATAGTTHKMAKDQTRTVLGFKMEYGDFDIGLTRYNSGAIQLDGMATAAHKSGATCPTAGAGIVLCSLVPSGDVDMTSLALLGRYKLNENISFLGGLNRYEVSNGTVQTLTGYYEGVSGDEMVPMAGAAYENEEIALRVELLVQPETDMSLAVKTSQAKGLATTAATNSKLVVPQTMTLNFQSGIAEDTLMFGSIHKADWDSAQITIPTNNSAAAINTSFSTRTAYSVGIGRKINDSISVLGSYSTEDGGGATSTDPFTLTDGSQTLGLGVRYTRDNMTISGGYSYTKVGDVTVTSTVAAGPPPVNLTAAYANNKVTGLGLKIGFSF